MGIMKSKINEFKKAMQPEVLSLNEQSTHLSNGLSRNHYEASRPANNLHASGRGKEPPNSNREPPNFRRLVLGCIEDDFATEYTIYSTAQNT